jgi:hypothetical protein
MDRNETIQFVATLSVQQTPIAFAQLEQRLEPI